MSRRRGGRGGSSRPRRRHGTSRACAAPAAGSTAGAVPPKRRRREPSEEQSLPTVSPSCEALSPTIAPPAKQAASQPSASGARASAGPGKAGQQDLVEHGGKGVHKGSAQGKGKNRGSMRGKGSYSLRPDSTRATAQVRPVQVQQLARLPWLDGQAPRPEGEVAELLAELSSGPDGQVDPREYRVRGTWDLEGLRSDAQIHREDLAALSRASVGRRAGPSGVVRGEAASGVASCANVAGTIDIQEVSDDEEMAFAEELRRVLLPGGSESQTSQLKEEDEENHGRGTAVCEPSEASAMDGQLAQLHEWDEEEQAFYVAAAVEGLEARCEEGEEEIMESDEEEVIEDDADEVHEAAEVGADLDGGTKELHRDAYQDTEWLDLSVFPQLRVDQDQEQQAEQAETSGYEGMSLQIGMDDDAVAGAVDGLPPVAVSKADVHEVEVASERTPTGIAKAAALSASTARHLPPGASAETSEVQAGIAAAAPEPVTVVEEQVDWAQYVRFMNRGSSGSSSSSAPAHRVAAPLSFSVDLGERQPVIGELGAEQLCAWLGQRLGAAALDTAAGAAHSTFGVVLDFTNQQIGLRGVRALCKVLTDFGVRCGKLKLQGNALGDEGLKEIVRFLCSKSQAPVLELHVSENQISLNGAQWLLTSLALHPAYPIQDASRHAFIPFWLRLDRNAFSSKDAASLLSEALPQLHATACRGMGDQQCGAARCVWMRHTGARKHNCIVHMYGFLLQDGPRAAWPSLPTPSWHDQPIFEGKQHRVPWPGTDGAVEEKAPPETEHCPQSLAQPHVLYEDADCAVVLKPWGWTCAGNRVDAAWTTAAVAAPRSERRARASALQAEAQAEGRAPALPAYVALRFGGEVDGELCRDARLQCSMALRLDIDTSGPVLIGKSQRGLQALKGQLRTRDVVKDYVALVHGALPQHFGEINVPIDDSGFPEQVCRVGSAGRDALTVYESLEERLGPQGEIFSLLHLRMITGRTHQPRVHLAHIGHPIVGDERYTTDAAMLRAGQQACRRLFLHEVRIGFCAASSGEPVVVWSPLADVPELLAAWRSLGQRHAAG